MEFNFDPTVDSIDTVPSDFRGLYEEVEGGKFVFKSDEFSKSMISLATGLNTALKASRAEARALKGKSVDLSALADYGDSPEAIAEAFTSKLAEAGKGKKSQEDIDRQVTKIKADLAQEYETKLETSTSRGDNFKSQLYTHLVTSEAKTALAEAGAINSELALPFVQGQVKVSEGENGKFMVHVVDKTGDPRYSGVTSSPMSVKELVAEIKSNKEFAPLFKSESSSGGGTTPEVRMARQTVDDADKKPVDKIRAGIEARRRNKR